MRPKYNMRRQRRNIHGKNKNRKNFFRKKVIKHPPVFRYEVKGGEIKVDRKEKTVTRSSVEMAYKRALEGGITEPKKLGVFGASYLYSVFVRIGVV